MSPERQSGQAVVANAARREQQHPTPAYGDRLFPLQADVAEQLPLPSPFIKLQAEAAQLLGVGQLPLVKRDGEKEWVGAGGRVTKSDIARRAHAIEHDGDLLLRIGDAGRELFRKNGIADEGDVMRARFIAEHLYQAGWAIQRGLDLRGYFHWALVDNFEWANGFCPKFGLHSVDPATGVRTPRPSASLYAQIIRAGKLTRDLVDAQPAYGAPTLCE